MEQFEPYTGRWCFGQIPSESNRTRNKESFVLGNQCGHHPLSLARTLLRILALHQQLEVLRALLPIHLLLRSRQQRNIEATLRLDGVHQQILGGKASGAKSTTGLTSVDQTSPKQFEL